MKLVELSPYHMRMPHVEMSWFVSIVRDNVLETFSIFFHGIRIRYGDNSTSFMIFGIRLHFIQLKKPLPLKLAALPREHVDRNFETVPGFSLNLH